MARYTKWFLGVGVLALLVGGSAVALYSSTQMVPDFYSEAAELVPEDQAERQQVASAVEQMARQLIESTSDSAEWSQELSAASVNSWLIEEFPERYGKYVPRAIQEPRIRFADGFGKIGFRYADSRFEGVITVRVRPEIVGPNRLDLHIESVSAGMLPLAWEDLLKLKTRKIEDEHVRVEIDLEGDEDVIHLELLNDRPGAPIVEQLEVVSGALRVSGSRLAPETQTTVVAERQDDTKQLR